MKISEVISGISKSFLLLQFLVIYENPKIQKPKKIPKTKKITTIRYCLISKEALQNLEFSILVYIQNRKSGNLGKSFLLQSGNSRSKNKKRPDTKKIITL